MITTIAKTKELMAREPQHWATHLMNFVDDFRFYKNPEMVAQHFELSDEKMDALLAATVAHLCDELNLEIPAWVWDVPTTQTPFFVSGIESLKAIALVESPVRFRQRNVFVLSNFLDRV